MLYNYAGIRTLAADRVINKNNYNINKAPICFLRVYYTLIDNITIN